MRPEESQDALHGGQESEQFATVIDTDRMLYTISDLVDRQRYMQGDCKPCKGAYPMRSAGCIDMRLYRIVSLNVHTL